MENPANSSDDLFRFGLTKDDELCQPLIPQAFEVVDDLPAGDVAAPRKRFGSRILPTLRRVFKGRSSLRNPLKNRIDNRFTTLIELNSSDTLSGLRSPMHSLCLSDATMNMLILGATGSGKTTSIALPAFERLVSLKMPGLALDVKGDFARRARWMSDQGHKNVEILGCFENSRRINVIGGWSASQLEDWLRSRILDTSNHENMSWSEQGLRDVRIVFLLLEACKGSTPTLFEIFDAINNPRKFCTWLSSKPVWADIEKAKQALIAAEDRIFGDGVFSLFQAGSFRIEVEGVENQPLADVDTERLPSQYTWRMMAINPILSRFCADPRLRYFFCAEESLPLDSLIYDQNKVLVVDLPIAEFGDSAALILDVIRENFYRMVKSCQPSKRLELGLGYEKFTFLAIDEYQQYLVGAKAAERDNLWLDTSRGYGHINMLCTQSISSLYAHTNKDAIVDTVVQNCRNVFVLNTTDSRTIRHIESLTPTQKSAAMARSLLSFSPGRNAFVYTPFSKGLPRPRVSLCTLENLDTKKEGIKVIGAYTISIEQLSLLSELQGVGTREPKELAYLLSKAKPSWLDGISLENDEKSTSISTPVAQSHTEKGEAQAVQRSRFKESREDSLDGFSLFTDWILRWPTSAAGKERWAPFYSSRRILCPQIPRHRLTIEHHIQRRNAMSIVFCPRTGGETLLDLLHGYSGTSNSKLRAIPLVYAQDHKRIAQQIACSIQEIVSLHRLVSDAKTQEMAEREKFTLDVFLVRGGGADGDFLPYYLALEALLMPDKADDNPEGVALPQEPSCSILKNRVDLRFLISIGHARNNRDLAKEYGLALGEVGDLSLRLAEGEALPCQVAFAPTPSSLSGYIRTNTKREKRV